MMKFFLTGLAAVLIPTLGRPMGLFTRKNMLSALPMRTCRFSGSFNELRQSTRNKRGVWTDRAEAKSHDAMVHKSLSLRIE